MFDSQDFCHFLSINLLISGFWLEFLNWICVWIAFFAALSALSF